jgi:hypothetical protein
MVVNSFCQTSHVVCWLKLWKFCTTSEGQLITSLAFQYCIQLLYLCIDSCAEVRAWLADSEEREDEFRVDISNLHANVDLNAVAGKCYMLLVPFFLQ